MSTTAARWAPYAVPADTSGPTLAAMRSSELLDALQDTCTVIQRATADDDAVTDDEFADLLNTRGRIVVEMQARLARAGATRRISRHTRSAAVEVAV